MAKQRGSTVTLGKSASFMILRFLVKWKGFIFRTAFKVFPEVIQKIL